MTDSEDMANWELMHGDVTAAQIKAAYEEALAKRTNTEDQEELKTATRNILASYGGSWEGLARAWTTDNWQRAFAHELHGKTWLSLRSPEEQHEILRDLIQQYPIVAGEILSSRDTPKKNP
ncbi:hypothetical protein ACIBKY_53240 [Nonomuraea sp. NPDC050394]|uniref:hypothetical protein n=1 Tax=Nonomuraea sp. NPDC050394 TaxID=3364363 RepID=UPI003788CA0C